MGYKVMDAIKGGLIVSCQALENEPLYSSFIMSKMAYAAMLGGAVGIRANSGVDIKEIRTKVDLPLIGIRKRVYKGFEVFITPTIVEVDEVVEAGADIVAIDATDRPRPDEIKLEDFVKEIRSKYPDLLIMGDISKLSEGIECERLGFDFVGTTLRGYTEDTKDINLPDLDFIKTLTDVVKVPIIAEGGIWTPEEAKMAMELGAYAVVVGTAITRPTEITKRYVQAIKA